jgi:hypothetical protein
MERDKGPTDARRRLAALGAALALAGCGGHATLNAASGGLPPPGTVASGGAVSVHYEGASAAGAVVAIGFLGAVLGGADIEREAALDPGRSVNVQDCARPIENPTANLKCR